MSTLNRRGSRTSSGDKGSIKMGLLKKLDCEIRDVSPGGARIVAPEGVDLPDEFVMRFPQFKRPRTCLRRWQSGREFGVEFAAE